MTDLEEIYLLGVGITNAKETEVLEYITTSLHRDVQKYYIVTPNPELLVIASRDTYYKNILNNAKLALPDGVGVVIGAWVMGSRLKQRVTGVDLVESLCRHIAKQPITVGFLGSGPNVADKAVECLREKYPGLDVKLVAQEWKKEFLNIKIDVLFVAFGSPKQEIWINDNLKNLPVKVVIGVGGAFDFISGNVLRAPKILRRLGLEWLFRLIIQPWRIKRQLSLITFIILVLRERFSTIYNRENRE